MTISGQLFRRKNERGATAVEYAVIVFLVVLAVIVIVKVLERQGSQAFTSVGDKVKNFSSIK
jgi:Flp pilus assembly pilin Flp